MEAAEMHVYDITTGKHVTRLPFTLCSWQESRNREGGMSAELAMTDVLRDMGARDCCSHGASSSPTCRHKGQLTPDR